MSEGSTAKQQTTTKIVVDSSSSSPLPKFEVVQINDEDILDDNNLILTATNIASTNKTNRLIEEIDDDDDDDDQRRFNDGSTNYNRNLYLFEEGETTRPRVSSLLSRLANYDDAIQTAPTDGGQASGGQQSAKKKANLGTLTGVYLPCIQNIFGVIIFIRMAWMTGTAGVLSFFMIVLLCCLVTFTTSISLSAIATNGIVPAGGSYFMISRSLGPEFGGAVGILFFLGTSVAGAMYITGAVEILLNYVAPGMALFGDFHESSILYHNIRLYGTLFLIIIGILVMVGVKFVSKFAPIALVCVLFSIFSIYFGIFINYNGIDKYKICMVGDRIVQQSQLTGNNCTRQSLRPLYCWQNGTCNQYFLDNEVKEELAIPGLLSGAIWSNLRPQYRHTKQLVSMIDDDVIDDSKSPHESQLNSYITVDITTSFTILVAIYFPSCTGILAGSNRSGDLKDAQSAIPKGTIAAQLTTTFVYLSVIILFGASMHPLFLRDKFGESLGGQLAVTLIAWPHPVIILIGALLSTFGASLQSLVGAPRLLQAIAKDSLIPFLDKFQKVNSRNEPVNAIFVSLLIAEFAILIGNLDFIAPVLTMFFLMCYMFINLACTLQSLLKSPSWRPRFKYYHWFVSMSGICLCLLVMFLSSYIYAILAMLLAASIYKYIEYHGAEKEWGDGITGLALSAARFSLLKLEDSLFEHMKIHTKNWRPQLLILVKLKSDSFELKNYKLLTLGSQLKAGKGLTIVASVMRGNYENKDDINLAKIAQKSIKDAIDKEKVKGFAEIVVSRNILDGLSHLIQTAGLGGLKHNTVIIGWPNGWRHSINSDKHNQFVSIVKQIIAGQFALIVVKGIQQWPDSNDRLGGTIDIWWIVHDGGLLILLGFILKLNRTWKNCLLRIFTVAQLEDNSIQMKQDLIKFLYHLRIEAQVEVIEMIDNDITAYTYERTLLMEQRTKLMTQLINEQQQQQDNGQQRKSDELIPFSPTDHLLKVADESNVKRMHTAVKLNESIVQRSHSAKLVIINMPGPTHMTHNTNYMEFLETLTEGLDRVLLCRGTREVITIYS